MMVSGIRPLGASASLLLFGSLASSLVIDVTQYGVNVPLGAGTLRLCRPIGTVGATPVIINPLKTRCPQGYVHWWNWEYSSPNSIGNEALIRLIGPQEPTGGNPVIKSSKQYGTEFRYGFSNKGEIYQPSEFKIFRGERAITGQPVTSRMSPAQQLMAQDELRFAGPLDPNARDITLRLRGQQGIVPGISVGVLFRQTLVPEGNAFNSISPTVLLTVARLDNVEPVAMMPEAPGVGAAGPGFAGAGYAGVPTANTPQAQGSWWSRAGNAVKSAGNWAVAQGSKAAGAVANAYNNYAPNTVIQAGKALGNNISNAATWIKDAPGKALDATVAAGAAAGQYVKTAAGNALNTIKTDLNGVGNAINMGIQDIKTAVNNGAISAAQGFNTLKNGITNSVQAGYNDLANSVQKGVNGLVDKTTTLYNNGVATVNGLYDSAANKASNLYNSAAGTAEKLYNGAANTASNLYNGTANMAKNVYNSAANAANNLANKAGSAYDRVANTATNLYNGAANTALNLYKGAANATNYIANRASSAYDKAATATNNLANKVSSAVGSAYDKAAAASNNFANKVSNAYNGVVTGWNAVTGAPQTNGQPGQMQTTMPGMAQSGAPQYMSATASGYGYQPVKNYKRSDDNIVPRLRFARQKF